MCSLFLNFTCQKERDRDRERETDRETDREKESKSITKWIYIDNYYLFIFSTELFMKAVIRLKNAYNINKLYIAIPYSR